MDSIRAVILDDERYAVERLRKLLSAFGMIHLLGCFSNSQQGIDFILKNRTDLVFLDVEMENNVSAFDIINILTKNRCNPFFVIVTAHPQYSIRAIKNNVFDYLLKPVDVDELKSTLQRIHDRFDTESLKLGENFTMLSTREQEILRYVMEGKSSQQIAGLLFISTNTVNTHRRNILKKTGAASVIDLMRIRNGRHF